MLHMKIMFVWFISGILYLCLCIFATAPAFLSWQGQLIGKENLFSSWPEIVFKNRQRVSFFFNVVLNVYAMPQKKLGKKNVFCLI